MKKNRSNRWTRGLCCTFENSDKRICLFELDSEHLSDLDTVLNTYSALELDVLVHRTGNGLHFLSPTMVSLETWKDFHSRLKGINPKCPMTTLRIEPNKYTNESDIWYTHECFYNNKTPSLTNSIHISNLLNHYFSLFPFSSFLPLSPSSPPLSSSSLLKFVRYPLPE